MSIQFIDREGELKVLEESIKSDRASLIVIFGRRRIGKTTLILKLLEKYPGYYIYVEKLPIKKLLEKLSTTFKESFASLDSFLEFIFKKREKIIIVLDEYQRSARQLSQKLQYYWDLFSASSKLKLILLGSTVGMIERDISYTGPLYGRATKIIKLNAFDYCTIREMFKSFDEADIIKIYSIFGGTPYYLLLYDKKKSLEENIWELFFERGAPLYEEVERLLSYELRDLARYLSILEAISLGKLTLKEISDYTKLERFQTRKYLYVLERIGVIKKELSIAKSKVPRYAFEDNFFEFYMRFISKNKEFIESNQKEFVFGEIKKQIYGYYGRSFEKICLQLISKKLKGYKVGKYWDNEGNEIDALAIRNREAIFFECKFGKFDKRDEKILEEKAKDIGKKLKMERMSWYLLTPKNLFKTLSFKKKIVR